MTPTDHESAPEEPIDWCPCVSAPVGGFAYHEWRVMNHGDENTIGGRWITWYCIHCRKVETTNG